jgi:heat shock protein HslJ
MKFHLATLKNSIKQGQHFNPPKFTVASVVSIATLFKLQLQPLYFDNVIASKLSSHTTLELQFADHTACKMDCNQYYFSSTLMPSGTHISKNS